MKEKFSLFGVMFMLVFTAFSQTDSEIDNMRSDTIDVLNYNLKLDFTAMTSKILTGSCEITFKSKMNNVQGISLDLLGFTIDEVKSNGNDLSYVFNDTLLRINFNSPMSNGEEGEITIKYHGTPKVDASGFGGFYFQNDYAYNMGVGFEANPHNYGRTWHPCFDNFVERATYAIEVVSPQGTTAYSNGYIVSESVGQNNTNIRKWRIEEEIPSYLACVGVAPFVHVSQTYTSNIDNTQIPVMLAAKSEDTVKLKNSFVHLFDAMDTYEASYGPYRWNKIGYTVVPFNGGAMEHATNIMYPLFAVNGNLQYETLMAHELSHHWWGNLVTCRTAEDMWINEGLASYSESLFLEDLYGYQNYLANIKKTHLSVIQKAHYKDGGFFPLSGVPHNITYGSHTYDKGATMSHNLRTYMGDEAFFKGLKAIQNQYEYKDIDAAEFRDALTNSTNFDATEFFKSYIFNPGFNGFEVDSFIVHPQGNQFDVQVFIQQKLYEAPDYFNEVPLQITFLDTDWNSYSVKEIVSGATHSFTVSLPFLPVLTYLNKDDGLLNSVTAEELIVTTPTTKQMDYAYFYLIVQGEEDSSFVRVEHCRIAPDPIQHSPMNYEFKISPDRYWKIDGIWSESFKAKGRLVYDARNTASGNLDNGLFIDNNGSVYPEDSLVLLWRPNQSSDWSVDESYELMMLADKQDGYGRVTLNEVKKGEYALAIRKNTLGVKEDKLPKQMKIYPNPAKKNIQIEWKSESNSKEIKIFDMNGKQMDSFKMVGKQEDISIKNYPSGVYNVLFYDGKEIVGTQKIVKE